MLENVLRRVDINLRHFDVILSKSQKGFVTRLILPSWWRLRQPFCDLDKITSKWRKKYLHTAEHFQAYPTTSLGSKQSVAESLNVIWRTEEIIFDET